LETYAAAEAKISWRFALVNITRTAVKIKVKTNKMLTITPVDEQNLDWVRCSKMYTVKISSVMIAEKLRDLLR
jgi:hypothetical protein